MLRTRQEITCAFGRRSIPLGIVARRLRRATPNQNISKSLFWLKDVDSKSWLRAMRPSRAFPIGRLDAQIDQLISWRVLTWKNHALRAPSPTSLLPYAIAMTMAIVVSCGSQNKATKLNTSKDQKQIPSNRVAADPIPTTLDQQIVDPNTGHAPEKKSPVLDVMSKENQRWMTALRSQNSEPAYYLSYQLRDRRIIIIEAEGGALVTNTDENERMLDVEVRVGSFQLDNRRPLSGDDEILNQAMIRRGRAPLSDDPLAIRTHLWLETDRRYREAAAQYRWVKTDRSVLAQDKTAPDFSPSKKVTFIQAPATLKVYKPAWRKRARTCSKKAHRGKATRASCRYEFRLETTYFVNSEDSQLQQSWTSAQIAIAAGVKTPDGMPLNRVEQRFATTPAQLPNEQQVDQIIQTITDELSALHDAPVVDPYVGPAILEGRAAAVFFHEVFGHRVEGHRQKSDISGQTFSSKVGQAIMPKWITIQDNPTVRTINGITLNGFYRFDDEGVQAARTSLVNQGVLEGFVLGRNPIKGFAKSNGHGRKQPGQVPVSRQGNLIVEASQTVPDDKLVTMLIDELKRQRKPFGMIFSDISGGFTNTTRFAPQAFKVNPVMAYRIYPDGRKELVRGVDIVGTPLTALGAIIAAGRTIETFNGMCGAESGWVPVSASAPSFLLKQLEVERGFKPTNRAPVLPPPAIHHHGRGL